LRDILARYSVNDPADLLFRRGTHGKPVLSRGNLRFNLSHAGDSALVAVSIGAEVGVDLERVRRNLRCVELAERLFTPDESRSVATAQDPVEVFFRLWTCKESYLKCLGYGLKRPLDTFRVRLAEHGGPASLTARGGSPLGWSVTELRPWNDFAAAITVEGEAAAVHQWTWPGSDQLVVGSIQCLRRSKG
jgi:4'-phosphopantetheinyl transferase